MPKRADYFFEIKQEDIKKDEEFEKNVLGKKFPFWLFLTH